MSASLTKLENLIGHKFQDLKILERAITHRSWAFENLPNMTAESIREHENESLEFVGDAVLGLVITEQLYRGNPNLSEGGLTLMKHHLVSMQTLARIAEDMSIGEYLRFGRGEEKTGGRRKTALLANTLEAVVGAVFLDGGYTAARVFVRGIFAEELLNATPKGLVDYKSLLQETLQAEKLPAPSYNLLRSEGPPHERVFYVEAVWKSGRSCGQGNSIKAAEMMAAAEALSLLKPESEAST